jgi:hypothetical protein
VRTLAVKNHVDRSRATEAVNLSHSEGSEYLKEYESKKEDVASWLEVENALS